MSTFGKNQPSKIALVLHFWLFVVMHLLSKGSSRSKAEESEHRTSLLMGGITAWLLMQPTLMSKGKREFTSGS